MVGMLSYSTELRHLPTTTRHKLIALLDVQDNWKQVVGVISNPDRQNEPLFKSTQVEILEQQRKRPTGGSPTNAMLEYWGTYGRRRHTLGDAVGFLEQCSLQRAADVIRECVERSNDTTVNDSFATSWNDLLDVSSRAESVKPTAPNQSLISFDSVPELPQCFTFDCVRIATDNFADHNKLGEGTFGQVYRGASDILNISSVQFVAVKKLKSSNSSKDRQAEFVDELNTMCRFKHPNLVGLFGYCNDGPEFCLITEYLEMGSLQDFLTAVRGGASVGASNTLQHVTVSTGVSTILSMERRLRIALDIASALVYLHNYVDLNGEQRPFIHRDIKSANILLDRQLVARVADLGLVREGSSSQTSTSVVTATIIGTSVYMAPEAFRGDVSPKTDTFSFGVVLLELLSGQSAFDASREESQDIVSYLDEILGDVLDDIDWTAQNFKSLDFSSPVANLDFGELCKFLDVRCPNWNTMGGINLLVLGKFCVEQRKKNRPTMNEVLVALQRIDTHIQK